MVKFVHSSKEAQAALAEPQDIDWNEEVDDELPQNNDGERASSSGKDASSTNNDSTTDANSNRTGGTEDDLQTIKEALTQKETKQVFRLRVIVILILLGAAASISATVYHITHSGEVEEFEAEYFSSAGKIIDALQEVMVAISAVSGIGVIATSYAEERQQEWPFVALNSAFHEKTNNARALSGALYLSMNPLVEADEREEWEKFVLGNSSDWM